MTSQHNSVDETQRAARDEQLAQLAAEVRNLSASPLYAFRTEHNYKMVFGEGASDAAIMFIGEAPGEQEAKQGRPFVGASGRMLNELLQSIGLDRARVYITNVVKDRPPNNRNPRKAEIQLYAPFLAQQIAIIRPRVLAPLGRFAMEFVFDHLHLAEQGKISQLHGSEIQVETEQGAVVVVPLYHPAVALYNSNQRDVLFQDFQTLKKYL